MAITAGTRNLRTISSGQNGVRMLIITGNAWSTTDVTGTIATGLSRIFLAIPVLTGSATADAETYTWSASGGTLTVERVVETGGSITSAGTFDLLIFGY